MGRGHGAGNPVSSDSAEVCSGLRVRAVAATQVWLLNSNVAISKTYSEVEPLP